MSNNPTILVKEYLGMMRVSRLMFDDLMIVAEVILRACQSDRKKIFDWFVNLERNEIVGWRNRECTRKVARFLLESLNGKKTRFYALFCPSYKKGFGAFGVRTDGVGQTTIAGLRNLKRWHDEGESMGFSLEKPLAIFFDVALEHADKIIEIGGLKDFERNLDNFRAVVPEGIDFIKLSDLMPDVMEEIGYEGKINDPLPIPIEIYKRIVERGGNFILCSVGLQKKLNIGLG